VTNLRPGIRVERISLLERSTALSDDMPSKRNCVRISFIILHCINTLQMKSNIRLSDT